MKTNEKSPIIQPTKEEIEFVLNDQSQAHKEEIARRLAMWDKLADPQLIFYLPVEEDDTGKLKLYMEAPREHETWLDGIVVAFMSQHEIQAYIDLLCEKKNEELPLRPWVSTQKKLYEIMPGISKKWKESGQTGGIRVELHRVDRSGIIVYVDTLYDDITT